MLLSPLAQAHLGWDVAGITRRSLLQTPRAYLQCSRALRFGTVVYVEPKVVEFTES